MTLDSVDALLTAHASKSCIDHGRPKHACGRQRIIRTDSASPGGEVRAKMRRGSLALLRAPKSIHREKFQAASPI
jgi:hypothetical protein